MSTEVVVPSDIQVPPAVEPKRGGQHSCPQCGRTFNDSWNLKRHMISVHEKQPRANKMKPAKPKSGSTSTKKLSCPECGLKFSNARTLGQHRKWTHGALGRDALLALKRSQQAQESGNTRKIMPSRSYDAFKTKSGSYQCPECKDQGNKRLFDDPKVLSVHRRGAHGVKGSSKESLRRQGNREREMSAIETPAIPPQDMLPKTSKDGPIQCPDCSFIAKTQRGLGRHQSNAHPLVRENKLRNKSSTNGAMTHVQTTSERNTSIEHQPKDEAAFGHQVIYPYPNLDSAVAVAFGRYEALCERMAYEYNLPAKLLAAQLQGLISAQKIR